PYVAGLCLDGLGFLLALAAMRSLPVFAVEAIVASYVAVTAVLAAWLLGARPRPREWCAVAGVAIGLALLAMSASPQSRPFVGLVGRWALLATVLVLAGSAAALGRHRSPTGATVVGFVGGLIWGVVPIATRILPDLSVTGLVTDPAAYAIPAAGGLGL